MMTINIIYKYMSFWGVSCWEKVKHIKIIYRFELLNLLKKMVWVVVKLCICILPQCLYSWLFQQNLSAFSFVLVQKYMSSFFFLFIIWCSCCTSCKLHFACMIMALNKLAATFLQPFVLICAGSLGALCGGLTLLSLVKICSLG